MHYIIFIVFQNIRGLNNENLGIVDTSGTKWQEQRRFVLKHLKDFGFGKQSLDTYVQDEANDLVDSLVSKSRRGVNGDVKIDGIFNFHVINILWRIIASKRNDPDSPMMKEFIEKLNEFFRTGPQPIQSIDFIGPFRPLLESEKNVLNLKKMFRQQIREHQEELDEMEEPKDLMDIYLREIERERKEKGESYSPKTSNFHIEQLVSICLDFFVAGSETTSTTLTWAIMHMALNPEV